jgi:hypothetical protein
MGHGGKKHQPAGEFGVIEREITGERTGPGKANNNRLLDAQLREPVPNKQRLLSASRRSGRPDDRSPMARPIGRQYLKTG